MLVQPNIERINTGFAELLDQYRKSADLLEQNKKIAHDEYVELNNTENGKISAINQRLYYGVIEPIVRYYPVLDDDLAAFMREILERLEKGLEQGENTENELQNIDIFLNEKRSYLLNKLYEPIR